MTTLCVVTGCRTTGRHLPDCPGDCAGCLPRVAEAGLACDWCVGRAAAQLETVIDTLPAARDIAQRQTSRSGGSGAGKPGSSLPLDLGATARLDAVQNALGTWARAISEQRGFDFTPRLGRSNT